MTTVLDAEGAASRGPAPPRGLRRRALLFAGVLWALALTALVLFRGGGDAPTAPVAAPPTPSASPTGPLSVA